MCSQSRDFFDGKVVAVLDRQQQIHLDERDGLLWVNWLIHPVTFDFDVVYIIQATDEEVERFVVQVGNDTDPTRKSIYKQARCLVSPLCHLSENSLRILRRMFGPVMMKEL
jgi:hypothetical protein